MAYDAFISYSHSADGQLAPAVQTGLQHLARPWYRRRALRIFRDDTGLSVNPHLWGSIQKALDESRYFVLLASPTAAASPWVEREVHYWLDTKSADTIMPVLTEGRSSGTDSPATSTSRRRARLRRRFLDLRWARDSMQLDVRHSAFRSQIADLAAPMHGIPKEDLEGEDVRMHRRALRLAWGQRAVPRARTHPRPGRSRVGDRPTCTPAARL
jgi:TIR domain